MQYFTPTREVPIRTHATVAAYFLRASLGHANEYALVARTGAGDLPVSLERVGETARVSMIQGSRFEGPFGGEARTALAAALGIALEDMADLPIQIVSTGHSKIMVPLKRRAILDALRPDMHFLSEISARDGCNGFFAFVLEGVRTLRSPMDTCSHRPSASPRIQ